MGPSKLITCDEGLRYVPALCESKGVPPTAVKSVTGDTPIVILEDGKAKYITIGEWIDARLDKESTKVQHFTERQMELLDLDNEVYIPTTDEDGRVTWGKVTAMTRHDPGTELYRIKTLGGRSVIVTESKSLLTWHPKEQKFIEVPTPEIKVGDFVPVTANLVDPPVITTDIKTSDTATFTLDYNNGKIVGEHLANQNAHTTTNGFWRDFLKDKCIPSVAFVAPKDFVKGILSAFLASNASVSNTSIEATTYSQRLAEGLAMLCSRLGIFCEIVLDASPMIRVPSPWSSKLIALIALEKTEMQGLQSTVQDHNDVVLDKIVDIEIIGVAEYPKVYDLTIPSTLNFGLANGLQVRDTSQTGYIQRKLVKAMEDCKVSYDMTVRNANGNIIQFLYGEDGIDAIKIENQPLHYVSMTPEKMEQEYLITSQDDFSVVLSPETIRQLKSVAGWQERVFRHFMQLHEDREFFIKKMFGGEQETSVLYPVSFTRIINNVHALCKTFNVDGVMSDLTPTFVLDEIDKLCAEVFVSRIDKGTKLFEMLARLYLSPKQMIFKFGFDMAAFKQVVQQVKLRFFDSIVHPSEMVGVVAAQSIGEPLSQTTLNSVEWNTELLLDVNGTLKRVRIGEFADDVFDHIDPSHLESHPNDTSLGWIKERNVRILSCDTQGQVSWKQVEAVTRHPVVNKDGSNTLIKVTLKSGRQVTATKGHSFLKRINNEIVGVDGDTLIVGDYLPISTVLPTKDLPSFGTDEAACLSIGESLANEAGGAQRMPAELLAAPDSCLKSVVKGYFSAAGDQRCSMRKGVLEDIQQILTRFGIKTSITVLQEGSYTLVVQDEPKFRDVFNMKGNATTHSACSTMDVIPNVVTRKFGDITIQRSDIDTYLQKCDNDEDRDILARLKQEQVYYDKIVSIEEVANAYPHAYDLTVADTRTFNVYNGVTQFDTFHLSGVSSASKAVRGVPRIEELTRVTKNVKAPSIVIYLRDEFSNSKEKSMEIKNKIETTTFRDIFKCSKIYFDPDDTTTSIEDDDRIVELYKEYQLLDEDCDRSVSPWLLRLELDRSKMLDRGLTMIDLHHALLNHFGNRVKCMFSDDNAANLIFRIKLYEDVSESANDMLTDLKAMESTILENVILKGIEKLNKVEILKRERLAYDDDTRTFQKTHEWCLDTDGTNLVEVLGLPYVDATRTVSNDVNEVYQLFGIEAARQCLYNEIYSVIKDAEAHVNFRHLSLLVDTMTSKGTLMSIDRHGINKGDIGPLAKCSFEEVNDVLVKAGVFSELDRVNGVSANIMLGQIAPCGTGDTEILIDESKLRDSIAKSVDLPRPAWELDDMDLAKEESCLADNFRLDFAVPDIDPSIQKKKV